MANSFIHYDVKNGVEYASIYTPCRINGKKSNEPEYLGRVIDKGNGVFRSRKRGLFTYNLADGYGDARAGDYADQQTNTEKLILDFGNAHCLYSILKTCGLYDIVRETLPKQEDTMMSLLGYRLLSASSNRYAEDWWEGSYTRILFPNAKLRSQRISEFYKLLGEEAVHRDFFRRHLRRFCHSGQAGVLIDSTGMPNDIHFPLTAINTHNGVTNNETRLLLVVDRLSKMPLFFRYNAGNIVDVTTLRSTIAELEAFGVNIDYAIVDAGYYSAGNVRGLYGEDDGGKAIPFLTRLGTNLKLYKQLASEHVDSLVNADHMLLQRNRIMSVKRVEVDLFGHLAYAYVSIDHARREYEISKYLRAALGSKDVSREEMNAVIREKGIFILISSEKIETEEVLPLYYTRQAVEQVFDVSKNNTDLLPLRIHSEETFKGHLLLSFISTVAFLMVNQMLKDTAYNAEGAFLILGNQKCKVFDDCVLPKEPNKKMNEIYKKLGIKSPISIPVSNKK